jgi:2-oxoglutarate ferredoxin oxidoreductase subunit alpha
MDLAEAEWRGKPAYTYRRYALTRDGVSPRLAPGFPGQSVRSLGAEHTEDGFQTEEATVRKQMHEKRMRKLEPMAASLEDLTCFPAEEDECVVACFGSTYGAVREAVTSLCAEKRRIGMVHFCELAPFPKERALARLGQAKKVITVEGNSTGQLAALLRRETGIKVESSILRYDGRPFTGQALAEELRSKCQ